MEEISQKKYRDEKKKEFLNSSFDIHMSPFELLEILLFYPIRISPVNKPERNPKKIAQALLERFGSIHAILSASIDDLKEVNGINEYTACFLKLLPNVIRVGNFEAKRKTLKAEPSIQGAHEFLVMQYFGYENEVLSVLTFKNNNTMIDWNIVSQGDSNHVSFSVRQILEMTIKKDAKKIIIAHNHPDDIAKPSKEDIVQTVRLKHALSSVDIKLLDHVIIVMNGYYSMALSGDHTDIFGSPDSQQTKIL